MWAFQLYIVKGTLMMEVLREFLESSTIHGLNYISTAKVSFSLSSEIDKEQKILTFDNFQSKVAKCAWALTVCGGFIIAGLLIGKSYHEWQKSPFSTTITTHPIEELDFPIVTVCPPKGSNTALNHDLMKADNESLTANDRKNLSNTAYEIFMEPFHMQYIEHMVAFANLENLDKMVDGFLSIPKPYMVEVGLKF